jgi:hypothetical protein
MICAEAADSRLLPRNPPPTNSQHRASGGTSNGNKGKARFGVYRDGDL